MKRIDGTYNELLPVTFPHRPIKAHGNHWVVWGALNVDIRITVTCRGEVVSDPSSLGPSGAGLKVPPPTIRAKSDNLTPTRIVADGTRGMERGR